MKNFSENRLCAFSLEGFHAESFADKKAPEHKDTLQFVSNQDAALPKALRRNPTPLRNSDDCNRMRDSLINDVDYALKNILFTDFTGNPDSDIINSLARQLNFSTTGSQGESYVTGRRVSSELLHVRVVENFTNGQQLALQIPVRANYFIQPSFSAREVMTRWGRW